MREAASSIARGQALEPDAQLGDGPHAAAVGHERPSVGSAIDEEANGGDARERGGERCAREVRQGERWNDVDGLPSQPERRPARDEDPHVGAAFEHRRALRTGREHLFEVVERQERSRPHEPPAQHVQRCRTSGDRQPERARDRPGDELRVAERREVDDGDAVREGIGHGARQLESQARLPDPGRPGQRDQADAVA